MRFKADKFCGIPCLCVSGTKVDGRIGSTDEWYFFRKPTSIISIIPSADRSDWDTIIINESSDEAKLARWNAAPVATAIRWTLDEIRSRLASSA